MAKTSNIPSYYHGSLVGELKKARRSSDPKRKDLSPHQLQEDRLIIRLARHFGFCFGVENAITVTYRTIEENPGKRIFLLSEVIHNPLVNQDLRDLGVIFLMTPDGEQLFPLSELKEDDIVMIPAFGTTLETIKQLQSLGINPLQFNATCPFVEKVWKRSQELGNAGCTIIIHGKRMHEETRATFSHARAVAPSIVIKDEKEASILCDFIRGKNTSKELLEHFRESYSTNFNPTTHLKNVGIVNQTTMLASDTAKIALMFKEVMTEVYGIENLNAHFADTRDTLCYATYENQTSVLELRKHPADLALVVGGYNSSNTSHLAELLEEKMPTYFIQNAESIVSANSISHFDQHENIVKTTHNWLPLEKPRIEVAVTAGASCPDKVVDEIISTLQNLVNNNTSYEVNL